MDHRLRTLERRFAETGDVSDDAALILERIRQGVLDHKRVFLAGQLGHEGARQALAPPTIDHAHLYEGHDPETQRMLCLVLAGAQAHPQRIPEHWYDLVPGSPWYQTLEALPCPGNLWDVIVGDLGALRNYAPAIVHHALHQIYLTLYLARSRTHPRFEELLRQALVPWLMGEGPGSMQPWLISGLEAMGWLNLHNFTPVARLTSLGVLVPESLDPAEQVGARAFQFRLEDVQKFASLVESFRDSRWSQFQVIANICEVLGYPKPDRHPYAGHRRRSELDRIRKLLAKHKIKVPASSRAHLKLETFKASRDFDVVVAMRYVTEMMKLRDRNKGTP